MQFPRAVDRKANQELALREKLAPFVIQQDAIGLQGIRDLFSVGVSLLQLDDLAEELDAQQRWLATLPGEIDLRARLAPDVLPLTASAQPT